MKLPHTTFMDRLLDPVAKSLSRPAARRLVNLRPDEHIQARLDELADKSTQGTLSANEQAEYEMYVETIDLIGILQAKARRLLSDRHAA